MGREFELKYQADPPVLSAIRENYGPFTEIKMQTVYYDTPAGAFRDRRWTLRCRLENGEPVCTVKTAGENGSRGEWELPCPEIRLAIPGLMELGAPAELAELAEAGLVPIAGVRFTRLACPVERNGSVLELALDQGEFLGEARNVPFCEVEVELKQGRDEDAVDFGRALAGTYGLEPQTKSKFKRALELAAERSEETI